MDQNGAWLETQFSAEPWPCYRPDKGKSPALFRPQCQSSPRPEPTAQGAPVSFLKTTPLRDTSATATLHQAGQRQFNTSLGSTSHIQSKVWRLPVPVFLYFSQMVPLCSSYRPSCVGDGASLPSRLPQNCQLSRKSGEPAFVRLVQSPTVFLPSGSACPHLHLNDRPKITQASPPANHFQACPKS